MPEDASTAAVTDVANVEQLTHDDYRKLRESRTPIEPVAKAEPSAATTHPVEETEEGEATTDGDSETPDTQEQPPKKKGGFQKRIDKLTKEKAELEARLAAVAAGTKPETPKPEPAKPEANGKPQAKDFETYEQYVESLTDWKLETKERERAQAAAKAAAEAETKKQAETWQEQLKEARTRYEDFDDVALSDAPISEAVHQAIVGSEHGADLAYFLGQNPAERERINALKPLAATLALGKILASFDRESPPENTKPKVSAAPPPIKPLGTKSATAVKRIEDMSMDEYRKARETGKIR